MRHTPWISWKRILWERSAQCFFQLLSCRTSMKLSSTHCAVDYLEPKCKTSQSVTVIFCSVFSALFQPHYRPWMLILSLFLLTTPPNHGKQNRNFLGWLTAVNKTSVQIVSAITPQSSPDTCLGPRIEFMLTRGWDSSSGKYVWQGGVARSKVISLMALSPHNEERVGAEGVQVSWDVLSDCFPLSSL